MQRFQLLPLLLAVVPGCSSDPATEGPSPGRPVTTLTLASTAPAPDRLIPGLVTPYRQIDVPFEVTGRVTRLLDTGDDVVGRQEGQDGAVVVEGTVIAEIDQAPFRRALAQAQQRLSAARAQLDAQVVQLDTVLPARLKSAESQAQAAELNASYARDDVTALEASVALAKTTLERNRELLPKAAVSDITVRQSEADLSAKEARLAQSRTLVTTREREHDAAQALILELQGTIRLQEATNEAQVASIEELNQKVLDAESDLEHCVLRAPFDARITAVHVGEGSFVQAGAPVATLTMMNPIEVEITVSSTLEERLIVGADAVVYAMEGNDVDLDRPLFATVYDKRGVANSGTRTFTVGLIVPNKHSVAHGQSADLPTAPYLVPIFDNPLDLVGRGGLYTLAEAVNTDTEPWVLKVDGITHGGRNEASLEGVLRARRVPVSLGENTVQVASFSLVEVQASEELGRGDLLVPSPTDEHMEGFVISDNRWLLRPGDLVQVSVDQTTLESGYYVPVQSIRELNGGTSVFVVDAGGTVRSVQVTVAESVGELRRIEGGGLEVGQRIVVDGAHFLLDGDAVAPVDVTDGSAR